MSLREMRNEKGKNAAEAALLVMQKVLTGYNDYDDYNYINLSADNNSAGGAREALLVMQRSETPHLNGVVGATPTSGAPASLNLFGKFVFSLFFMLLFSGIAVAGESAANVTKEDALGCINSSYLIMNELVSDGFNVARVNDSIKTAERAYEEQKKIEMRERKPDYSEVLKVCSEIKMIKDNAYQAKDEMFVLEKEYSDFLERVKNFDVNLSDMEFEMNDLRQEMDDERYERAIEKIPQVRDDLVKFEASATTLNLYYKTVTRGVKDFIIDNWIQILFIIVVVIILIIVYRVRFRKYLIKRKIRNLEIEKKIVLGLIQKTQKEYFEEGKMAEGEFNIKTKKFAELIRDIERQVPLLKEEFAMMDKRNKFKLEELINEGRIRRKKSQ